MATVQLTDSNFEELTRDKDVVIDFWAGWCGPCHVFAPVFEHVSERYPDVLFGKVDVESNPRLAALFSIRSIPTLVAMRQGATVEERIGALPAPTLDRLVNELFSTGDVRPGATTQTA
jgi:thioredoxin 1